MLRAHHLLSTILAERPLHPSVDQPHVHLGYLQATLTLQPLEYFFYLRNVLEP
jgi:hypothetical protein